MAGRPHQRAKKDWSEHSTTYGLPGGIAPLRELPPVLSSRLNGPNPSYRPEDCQTALELMARGYSLGAVAGELGVSRRTLFNWSEREPAFRDACDRGQAFRQRYWEGRLIEVAETGGTGSQGQVAMFGVLNAGRDDWSNRSQIEHSGNVSFASAVEAMIGALEQRMEEKKRLAKEASERKTLTIEHEQRLSEDPSDCF